jgi:hypothetical protein
MSESCPNLSIMSTWCPQLIHVPEISCFGYVVDPEFDDVNQEFEEGGGGICRFDNDVK